MPTTAAGAPAANPYVTACHQADASAQQAKTPVRNGVSRAVVIGGSVAGIFAAAVAAPYFDEVVIVERGEGPSGTNGGVEVMDGEGYLAVARRRAGSPQFIHPHAFLSKGWQLANAMLPGLDEAARVAGAVTMNAMADMKEVSLGVTKHFGKDAKTRLESVLGTRDVFERAMRERLAATHPNVAVRYGCGVTALKHGTGDAQGLVTGVAIEGGESLAADLVIDTSGRRSKIDDWLLDGGYKAPRTLTIDPNVGYQSTYFEAPQEVTDRLGWKFVYARPRLPDTRGALCTRIEHGRWQIVAMGFGKADMPPAGWEATKTFVDGLGVSDLSELLAHATPLFEPQPARGATDQRRFFEETMLPANLVVLGDAVATFNPSYGQGMTTAALQAEALRRQLQARALESGAPLDSAKLGHFSAACQQDFAQALAFPFGLAAGEDLKRPTTTGKRWPVSRVQALKSGYLMSVAACATADENVALAFGKVMHMLAPPSSLFTPWLLSKILLFRLRRLLFGQASRQGGKMA